VFGIHVPPGAQFQQSIPKEWVFGAIGEFERGDSNMNNHNCNSNCLHDDNNWNEKRISRPLTTRSRIGSVFVGIRDWRIILSPMVLCTTSTWPKWKYFWNKVIGTFALKNFFYAKVHSLHNSRLELQHASQTSWIWNYSRLLRDYKYNAAGWCHAKCSMCVARETCTVTIHAKDYVQSLLLCRLYIRTFALKNVSSQRCVCTVYAGWGMNPPFVHPAFDRRLQ
jgi:hypothetical protein